jgi:hypothetical protein
MLPNIIDDAITGLQLTQGSQSYATCTQQINEIEIVYNNINKLALLLFIGRLWLSHI